MLISKLRLAVPGRNTLKAVAVVLLAMGLLETVRVILFRTLLLDQPVAKTAVIAILCALLVKVIQLTCRRWGCIRLLRVTGFGFACAGAFVGYLPAVMVMGRPAYAHVLPMEFCFVFAGASAGLGCFLTILTRSWRRQKLTGEIPLH